MPLDKYLFSEENQFDVTCKDNTSIDGEISLGDKVYRVLGAMYNFFIMKNDKGKIGKYHRDRFLLKEEDE